MAARSPVLQIAVLVTPHFNIAATMAMLDAFRAANYLRGRTLFRWELYSESGGLCAASNGVDVATLPLAEMDDVRGGVLIVSTSWTPEQYASRAVLGAVRRAARTGTLIGGLDTGAFVLAQAGVLKGHRATCHYEHIDAFGEQYPEIDLREDLMVFDRNRATCAGSSAAYDFGLILLRQLQGDGLASAAAKYLNHGTIRSPGTRQADTNAEPIGPSVPDKLRAAIDIMEDHLETPLPLPEICDQVGISQRHLERLFKTHVWVAPAQYYRDIRLDRARGLVTQTALPMSEIALACGFASQDHFSRAYKDRFGLPPSRDRVEGRVPFEFRAWPMYRAAGESS